MKTLLQSLYVFVSIAGIADAGYITYEKFSGSAVQCGPGFDCGTVLNSSYANIGPIPLSAIGLVFYLTVLFLAVLFITEVDIRGTINRLADKFSLSKSNPLRLLSVFELIQLLTTFGALFSLYLIFIMGVVLQSWCQFCLISAATSFTLFAITAIYTTKYRKRSPFVLKTISFKLIHFVYTNLLKPILFLFDAEAVHNSFTYFGGLLGKFALTRHMTHCAFAFSHPEAAVEKDGIIFPNPVGLAAGFDYNGELTSILPDVGYGFHTIGTVTYDAYEGNPKPRLGRFKNSKGLLVNKGLKGLGTKAIIKKLQYKNFRIPTGISIASTNKHFESTEEQMLDILQSFQLFEASRVKHSYYELNISCPNTFGGEPFTSPTRLKMLLKALSKLTISRPIYIKMPIDQSQKETLAMLKVIDKFEIAGVIFGNLTKDKNNPAIDPADKETWKKSKGNISGRPTWERSNKLIKLTKKEYGNRFTIIGTGGIFSAEDAMEKMSLGADLVQVITGMIFEGPQILGEIALEKSKRKLL